MGDLVLKPNRKLSRKTNDVAAKLFPKYVGLFRIKGCWFVWFLVVYSFASIDERNAGKEYIRRIKPYVGEEPRPQVKNSKK